ncbi:MAG: anaerobic ribonucleoside triphosphate reductase, partial [Oscillospiraceae bacterium]
DGFSTGHGFLREPNDIQSYSALACIAIQSNQNDQHGGQSIPNFEYGMAFGVKKTYIRIFTINLSKSLELLANVDDALTVAKSIVAQIKEKYNLSPSLANVDEFQKVEREWLSQYADEAVCDRVDEFTKRKTLAETDRATFQAMEALIHNLNTMHSRAGAQIPFSSINYGLDTSDEGRMVMKNVLLATEKGLGDGETPIFPIQILKVKEGINYNPSDKNYDIFKLACKVSAKRLFPNFSFIDAPFNITNYKEGDSDSEVAYMGCRTRVVANNYDKSRQVTGGRGNLSFTSINLPRLGIEAKGDLNKFYSMLDDKMELICDQLLHRFKVQSQKKVKNYPFLMGQGVWLDSEKLGFDDEVGEVLKHGTLTMGFIGLAETLVALTGQHHGQSEESRKLGLEIVAAMRKKMDDKTKQTGLNFSLIATPAEGLSGRFVKIDAEKYGKIKGVTDREYYTNSFHIPVYFNINAFDKIRIEAPYHELTNGGHISYIELDGDPLKNLDAFEQVVRCMKESGVGYGSINHPVDRDTVCGYSGVIDNECPKCGRKESDSDIKFERIRRITGYLVGTVDRFNNAKRAEERDRVKHL